MTSKRIPYVSLLQIVGPLFVVLGHSLNGLDITGAWYVFSKEWIYIFHMPLFFLISGYLLAFGGYLRQRSYGEFVLGKVKRLIIPYVVWNLLFLIPKFFARDLISDRTSLNVADTLKAFIFPRANVWGHTWFLMGLFIVYLAAPLFERAFRKTRPWLTWGVIAACVILYVLPISTDLLALGDLHKDLLFFAVGCLLGQMPPEKFKLTMKKYRLLFICGAAISSAAALVSFELTKPLHFIPCAFILLSLLSIFVSCERLPVFLEELASCSFGIYIMHWPVMIVVRIILHGLLGVNAAIVAAAMSVLGYIAPILVIAALRALPLGKLKKPLKYLLGV